MKPSTHNMLTRITDRMMEAATIHVSCGMLPSALALLDQAHAIALTEGAGEPSFMSLTKHLEELHASVKAQHERNEAARLDPGHRLTLTDLSVHNLSAVVSRHSQQIINLQSGNLRLAESLTETDQMVTRLKDNVAYLQAKLREPSITIVEADRPD